MNRNFVLSTHSPERIGSQQASNYNQQPNLRLGCLATHHCTHILMHVEAANEHVWYYTLHYDKRWSLGW